MPCPKSLKSIIPQLEALYSRYHKREYVSPDPLQFLYDYPDIRDREIAGMVASALAYGAVKQILVSVDRALEPMGKSPYKFLMDKKLPEIKEIFADFKHRFTKGDDLAQMLWGIKKMIEKYGSLEAGFLAGLKNDADTIIPSLINFVSKIRQLAEENREEVCYGQGYKHLLPRPEKGGASKRLHLFLRWMVRKDAVDPGGWDRIPTSKLIVPIDIHMHRIGLALGLTDRKQANLKTALEITAAFREIAPHDPVKYDFALTRLGIRTDTDMDGFLRACNLPQMA